MFNFPSYYYKRGGKWNLQNSKYVPNNIKEGIGTKGLATKNDNKSNILLGNFTANYKKSFGKKTVY